jgi:hypothetical protein
LILENETSFATDDIEYFLIEGRISLTYPSSSVNELEGGTMFYQRDAPGYQQ